MRRFLQLFRPAALSAVVLAALLVDTGTVCAEVVYRFGVVPQFAPRQLANIWVPILKELESRTGLKFKMVGSPNIPKFEISFLAGEFDFAYMNPYHAMLASMQRGYVPLNRDHGRKLSGVLVVKKDDPIGDVKELDGMTISFPAPNALGASLLMRTDLAKIVDIKIKPLLCALPFLCLFERPPRKDFCRRWRHEHIEAARSKNPGWPKGDLPNPRDCATSGDRTSARPRRAHGTGAQGLPRHGAERTWRDIISQGAVQGNRPGQPG